MPFAPQVPNTETRAAMAEADEIARVHRARFGSAGEMFEDLEKNTGQQARVAAASGGPCQVVPQVLGAFEPDRALRLKRMDHGFEVAACWRRQASGSMAEVYDAPPSGIVSRAALRNNQAEVSHIAAKNTVMGPVNPKPATNAATATNT